MTACCETKRPDLTSDGGESGDESSGVAETENVDGLAPGEDGNLARLTSQPSSPEVFDGVEASALTIAHVGRYDGGELCTRQHRSVGENNANSNALISQDLYESAGGSVSSSSGKPVSRESTWPVGSYYPINPSLLDTFQANTTTTVTSPLSEPQCNFTAPVQTTTAGSVVRNEAQLSSHQDSPCRGHDVTNPSLTCGDDGRQTSGACVGNEIASNNFVTSHRSASGTARDNSISSPGLAGCERETGNRNISPPIPCAVDHSPFQSAAGETRTTGTATLNNKLKGNNCIQCDISIQGSDYSPDRCLDLARENSDKHACSFPLGASPPNDNDISIRESLNRCDGLNYSLQEYFISPEESCRKPCHDSSPCFGVDCVPDVFTDNSTVSAPIDTEPLLCSHGQGGARLNYAGHRTRRSSLEERRLEPRDTCDHCQAHNPGYCDSQDFVHGRDKVSSIRPSNLVHPSWNVGDHPVYSCLSHKLPVRPTPQGILSYTAENNQQTVVGDTNARKADRCHISLEPTAGTTQDFAGYPDPGDSYTASRLSSGCSDSAPVTSLRASSAPRESTNQTVHTHPLIRSPPRAEADFSDVSIIGSTQARLSVSDSDPRTEAINNFTLGNTSCLDFQCFSREHGPNTQQPLSGRHLDELCTYHCDNLLPNQQLVSHNRIQESEHFSRRQSLTNANRTLSTSSEEWSDTASPSDHYFRDKERHDSSVVSLEDTCLNGLQQRRRSFGRQRQVLSHNLGALSQLLREDSGPRNEPSSDDDGCDATSALLTADSDDEFQEDRPVDHFVSSRSRSGHACDGLALVSKQQHPERAKDSHEKASSGRTHFSRLVQSYCKDILRIRNNTDNISNYNSTCLPSAYISTPFKELNAETSRELSRTSTTTETPASTGKVPTPTGSTVQGATVTATGEGSSKPRVSFISGFRRQSRDRTAFLRVDHSEINSRESSSASSLHLQDGTAEAEVQKAGKRIGTGDRKKLKVEFAVMEGEGDKYIRGRCRGYGGGNVAGGIHDVKDDVENDVAMLGGGGLRFRQPRVSLLGKPLNYRAHRRDIKYRKLQSRIYNFLERPKSWQSWIYHLTVCCRCGMKSETFESGPEHVRRGKRRIRGLSYSTLRGRTDRRDSFRRAPQFRQYVFIWQTSPGAEAITNRY